MHAGNYTVGRHNKIGTCWHRDRRRIVRQLECAGMFGERPEMPRNQTLLGRRFNFSWHRAAYSSPGIMGLSAPSPRGNAVEAFDLYSPSIDADPFPYYAELRAKHPCYWSDNAHVWILSRYDDIVEAARDWETFSSSQGNMVDELPGRAGATLGTTDPPRHDRLRALSQAAFLKRNLDRMIGPTLEIADRSLERITEQKTFEFVNDFSSQITVGLLFRIMGLPERDHTDIRRKVILAVSTDKSVKGRTPEHIAAFKEISDFLTAEVGV